MALQTPLLLSAVFLSYSITPSMCLTAVRQKDGVAPRPARGSSMSIFKRGGVYWHHFLFAGRHIQETTKSSSKTLAKAAEQKLGCSEGTNPNYCGDR